MIIISAACKLEDLARSTHIYIWSIWLAYVSFMPLRFGSNGSTVGFSTKVARPTLQADDVKTRIERRLGIGCLQSRRYLKVHEVVGRDAKKQTYILLDAQGLQDLEA